MKSRSINNRVHIGERFSVSFQRTLRIPDDGRVYPLPPGLGLLPVQSVAEFKERTPASWVQEESYFIPLYQREALWLGFDGARWKPNAVKIGVGKVNVISGGPWDERLRADPQDYIVCPDQPWLDGINAGEGFIRQFVATPLGQGYSVESQVAGTDTTGGIQVMAFEPRAGVFPDSPPPQGGSELKISEPMISMDAVTEMTIAIGGKMTQKIYPDPYGIDVWDQGRFGQAFIYLVNSDQYYEITGLDPPPSPITAAEYTKYGLPWFKLYDELKTDLAAPDILKAVKSLDDTQDGGTVEREGSVEISDAQLKEPSPGRKTGEDTR